MRPAIEICVDRRAPFVPIGSLITCTVSTWPSNSSFSIGVGVALVPSCGRASQMSATCRNAARSRPMSMKADCMPGSTRTTLPMQMLPTRPRPLERSTRSSCTTPLATTATRVSRGVTLIRISSLTGRESAALRELLQKLGGLVERQAHDAGIAAAQLDDEARGASLDGIGAGLVVALAGGDVLLDFPRGELLEAHLRARQRALHPVVVLDRDGSKHFVAAARE